MRRRERQRGRKRERGKGESEREGAEKGRGTHFVAKECQQTPV